MRYVTAADAARLSSSALRAYVSRFVERARDMERTVAGFGLPVEGAKEHAARAARTRALREELASLGAQVRADGKSVAWGALSPACERCRTGVRSVSSFISLECNRSCWFCFNANQRDFEAYRARKKDWRRELDECARALGGLDFVALTGGEPLLYPDDALAFVRHARSLGEHVHVRLYTSGANLDEGLLEALAKGGLDEVRFSVKLEDDDAAHARLVDVMRMAGARVPCVMVEMPVVPGTGERMRELMTELETCGVFGVNLLELCFPLHRREEYAARGLALVRTPFRVPYAYGYAGALPVAGSEELALELMAEAARRGTPLNLHYCSLENKNTAQVYAQNGGGSFDVAPYRFSPLTFFFEVIRAFGDDARSLARLLDARGLGYEADEALGAVACDPAALAELASGGAGVAGGSRAAGAAGVAGVADALAQLTLFCASAVVEADDAGERRFCEVGLHVVEPADLSGGGMRWKRA